MGVALLRGQEGFRRVRGHKELGDPVTALGGAGSAAPVDFQEPELSPEPTTTGLLPPKD